MEKQKPEENQDNTSHPQMGSPIKIAFKANDVEGLLQKIGGKIYLRSNNSKRLFAKMTKTKS